MIKLRRTKKIVPNLLGHPVEYANTVWHPRYKNVAEITEKVKRRTTKLISTIQDMPYQRILQFMDLPSLVHRRYRGDMIEVYKFIHGIYTSGDRLLPRAPRSALRGHEYKLKK